MLVTIDDESKVLVTLAPVTKTGKPALVEGEPVWNVESGDATLDVQPGGMSAYLISGNLGDSVIKITADADLGPGVKEIADSVELTVTTAGAETLGLVIGTPEPK